MRGSTYHDGPYPGRALLRNKAAFCAVCGYRCILLRDEYASDRSPGWDKLRALADVLHGRGVAGGAASNCSLMLWLDADVRREPWARGRRT